MKRIINDRVFRALATGSLACFFLTGILISHMQSAASSHDFIDKNPPPPGATLLFAIIAVGAAVAAVLRAQRVHAANQEEQSAVAIQSPARRFVSVWVVLILLVMVALYFTSHH